MHQIAKQYCLNESLHKVCILENLLLIINNMVLVGKSQGQKSDSANMKPGFEFVVIDVMCASGKNASRCYGCTRVVSGFLESSLTSRERCWFGLFIGVDCARIPGNTAGNEEAREAENKDEVRHGGGLKEKRKI